MMPTLTARMTKPKLPVSFTALLLLMIRGSSANTAMPVRAMVGASRRTVRTLRMARGSGRGGLDGGPAALLLGAADPLLLHEQRAEDDHEQGDLDETGLRVVPQQQLLDDADDRAGEQRDRQGLHAGEHRTGEGDEQERRAEAVAAAEALGGLGEDRREAGERTGQAPGQRAHLGGADAGHAGGLGVRGSGPDAEAEPRELEEQADGEHDQGRQDQHAAVGRGDQQGADPERRQAHGLREQRAGRGLVVDREGEQHEELPDAEGRDDAHDGRGLAQAADDDGLGEGAGAGGEQQGRREGHPVRDVPADDGETEDRGPEGADLPVGEVDDAVGPVDEDQTDRQQAVRQADDQAQQEHRDGRLEVPGLGPLGVEQRQHDLEQQDREQQAAADLEQGLRGAGRLEVTEGPGEEVAQRRGARGRSAGLGGGHREVLWLGAGTAAGWSVEPGAASAPSRKTARRRSPRSRSSSAGPSKRIWPFSMK